MALLGTIIDRVNPPQAVDADGKPTRAYSIDDFLTWIPSYANVTNKKVSNSLEFDANSTYYVGDTDTVATPSNSNGTPSKHLYEKTIDGDIRETEDTDFLPNKVYYKNSEGTLVANPKNCRLYETELQAMFNNLYPIAYNKIFYSIFGADWYYAMSLCIAHYSYLINRQIPNNIDPNVKISLSEVTGGGTPSGVMTSAGIGGFNKTYDYNLTALSGSEEALFWNQSAYGMSLIALYKSKATLTAFVVTSGPLIPGQTPFNPYGDGYGSGSGQDWVDGIINPKKFRP